MDSYKRNKLIFLRLYNLIMTQNLSNLKRNQEINSKQLFGNEEVLRPILIFAIFFIFILLQNWSLISLFTLIIIPIITFSLFLFFRINIVLKKEAYFEIESEGIRYYPLGDEKQISDRLFFCLLLELILVLVIGTEGLYHPQLIDNHFAFYVIPLVLIFLFSMYYALHDIGFSAKIEVALKNELYDPNIKNDADDQYKNQNLLISYLKFQEFEKIFKLIQFSFGLLSIGWLFFSILGYFNIIPSISVSIPGSDLVEGNPLNISYFIIICIITIPILFFLVIQKTNFIISNFSCDKINEKLSDFKEYEKRKIVKILKYYTSN